MPLLSEWKQLLDQLMVSGSCYSWQENKGSLINFVAYDDLEVITVLKEPKIEPTDLIVPDKKLFYGH